MKRKKHIRDIVEATDSAQKYNPLDLSAVQDRTIAVMNLMAIEEISPNSHLGEMVRSIRVSLMQALIGADQDDKNAWNTAEKLLGDAISRMENGNKSLQNGQKKLACADYDAAYDAYLMFLAGVYGVET